MSDSTQSTPEGEPPGPATGTAPPRFAIVGHPNKGKSSLVATLAADDSVPIAAESGTTRRGVHYPMRIDGVTLYELVDTPGFQRARRALAWMREVAETAADRPAAVRAFVEQQAGDPAFQAEVELLTPIADGAAIIYVVDGAVPYGPEYDAEMEILRWSGRPSLAVINPIGARTHVEGWRDALGQYFRIVREVDVLSAPLERRLDLLRAFGELDPDWRPSLDRATEALRGEWQRMRRHAARIVAELIVEALAAAPERPLAPGEDRDMARAALEDQYREQLRGLEHSARDRVEQAYQHTMLARTEAELSVLASDLFEERTWELFGLDRTTLAGVAATSGAAAGLGIDAMLGGVSGFLGTAIGAVTAGGAAWLAADRLAEFDHEDLPLGNQVLRVRGGSNRNLPFVLLGRARFHHALVARRSHARREPLHVGEVEDGATAIAVEPLDGESRRALASQFSKLVGAEPERRAESVSRLAALIEPLLDEGA